jgi:membrane protease YdiL (CAAX protease family)
VLPIGGPEEPGWRGFALPRLQARFNALGATLILGAMWAVWHAPLFVLPIEVYEGLHFALSVTYTWLYNGTSGSVLLAMVLHGVTNLFLLWYPAKENALPQGALVAAAGIAAMIIVAIYGPAHLARVERTEARERTTMQAALT